MSRRMVLGGVAAGAVRLKMGDLQRVEPTSPRQTGVPEDEGEWSALFPSLFDTVPIHGTLMHTGKVLLFESMNAYVWDPVTDTAVQRNVTENIFCCGHTILGSGDVWVAGGILDAIGRGPVWTWTFSPKTETWRRGRDMPKGRYYPTCLKLADGTAIVTTGTDEEGLSYNEDIERLVKARLSVVGTYFTRLYPHQWVLPNGTVLSLGPNKDDGAILDPTTWTVTDLPDLLTNRDHAGGFLVPGGPAGSYKVVLSGGKSPAVEMIDAANPAAGPTRLADLPQVRDHMNTVLLPDGTVLGVGGWDTNSVGMLQSLLYDPSADTWTPMASQSVQRGYHSIALLLPDGRVLSTGDNTSNGGQGTYEIYSPPYLFRGPRPTITGAPRNLRPGLAFQVSTPDTIARVVLMAPGSVTHTNDMNQRHIELAFTPGVGQLTVMAPPSTAVAPVGHYMLFLLNPDGVPSVARWIRMAAS